MRLSISFDVAAVYRECISKLSVNSGLFIGILYEYGNSFGFALCKLETQTVMGVKMNFLKGGIELYNSASHCTSFPTCIPCFSRLFINCDVIVM